jgi:hypothetical protein
VRRGGWALAGLLAACAGDPGAGQDCGVPLDPGPMTPARASALAPEVRTGLGLSATWIRGDCRPRDPDAVPVDACGAGLCLRTRAPLRILVVPANVSVPLSPACGGAPRADALAPLAVVDGVASPQGELVVAVPPGVYSPYLVAGAGCAPCGDPGAGACAVVVEDGAVATRDLVLDEAAR